MMIRRGVREDAEALAELASRTFYAAHAPLTSPEEPISEINTAGKGKPVNESVTVTCKSLMIIGVGTGATTVGATATGSGAFSGIPIGTGEAFGFLFFSILVPMPILY